MSIQPLNAGFSAFNNLLLRSGNGTNGAGVNLLSLTNTGYHSETSNVFAKFGQIYNPTGNSGQQNNSLSSQSVSSAPGSSNGSSPIVTGVNSRQLTSFQTNTFTPGASETLSGTITQAATAATVGIQGTAAAAVISNGTIQLTGSAGTANLSIQQGESFADVANRINGFTSSTGVKAAVSGNQLVLQSTTVGSASNVSVQLNNVTRTSAVTGASPQQITGFQINSLAANATETISGAVTAASAASVALQGSNGAVIDSATFQLTGSLGTTSLSIQQGQSLSSVAANINSLANSTGVKASVSGNQLVFQSTGVGSSANVGVQLTNISHTDVVSGLNSSQLGSFQINSLTTGASETLSGTVTQAASAASVALQGNSNGTVIDSATFNLTGSLGATSISIAQGESLANVAANVNSLSNLTGVTASVNGSQVLFQSTGTGSAANVGIQLTDVTHTNVDSGVSSNQLASFQINSLTTGASETLSGTVSQAATAASVALQGNSNGTVIDSATFNLTGALGATSISITQGETLANVAANVNSLSGSTGVTASVNGSQVVFQSTGTGSAANVGIQLTNVTHTNVDTGVNSNQLSSFQINSLTTGASETLSGTVTQAATAASVKLQGNSNGTVIDSATFNLTGALGSTSISITQGQTLTSVASTINALSSSTGVQAAVSGNQLVFQSSSVGSAANVGVQLTNVTHYNVVTGVNSNQLSNFEVNSFTTGASETLNGSITQTAGIGQLTYTGSLGLVGHKSNFTLQGSLGSTTIATTSLESLSSLVSDVNAATATTGVTAVLSGNNVLFQTVGVGSSATVNINKNSGTFSVTGGNGNGTANGTDAKATINGQSLTGNANSFNFSDALGSYSFDAVAGFTGAISAVNITSQAGQFSVTGGNGNGTANGTDAKATINGQSLTGAGNSFTLSDSVGSYSFTTASGYTGTVSPISVVSQAGQFSVTGGNGDGTANGTNAKATINGQSLTGGGSSGNSFNFSDSIGSYSFTTVSGFAGTLNPIDVLSQAGQFGVSGGNGNGTATGADAQATINGQSLTGGGSSGNAFNFSDSVGSYSFTTASGFTGTLDPIGVASQAGQFNVTGGNGNGTATGANATATINGHTLTGQGNTFHLTDTLGSFTFTTVAGFDGAINPISVTWQDVLSKNVESQSASGTDAKANVNGQSLTGDGNSFQVIGRSGTYSFTTAAGFTGTLDPITITQPTGTTTSGGSPADASSPQANQATGSGSPSATSASNPASSGSLLNIVENQLKGSLIQSELNSISMPVHIAIQSTPKWVTSDSFDSTASASSDSSQTNAPDHGSAGSSSPTPAQSWILSLVHPAPPKTADPGPHVNFSG